MTDTICKKSLTNSNDYDSNGISTAKEQVVKCYSCHKVLFHTKGKLVIDKCKCGKLNYVQIE